MGQPGIFFIHFRSSFHFFHRSAFCLFSGGSLIAKSCFLVSAFVTSDKAPFTGNIINDDDGDYHLSFNPYLNLNALMWILLDNAEPTRATGCSSSSIPRSLKKEPLTAAFKLS